MAKTICKWRGPKKHRVCYCRKTGCKAGLFAKPHRCKGKRK